jgi:hypothetical protein
MARDSLPEDLTIAGRELLQATDALGMSAQGAMWIYSHALREWRYYLVTSLIDTLGRRKTYQLLIRAFELSNFPRRMLLEDVHLGSPTDPYFHAISGAMRVDGNTTITVVNCSFNGMLFDGVVYRSVREPPQAPEMKAIEKKFERNIRERERA